MIKLPVIGLIMALLVMMSGCVTLPGAATEKIGSRQVEYTLTRCEGPAVIFESGLGGTMDWWVKVYPEIAAKHTALAYNRAGYGKSDSVPAPRDGTQSVVELRALLAQLGLKPPYVLVGHSLGGLYMQLFARRYPDEVAALILVDSTHPEQLKGLGAPGHWPAWARLALGVAASDVAKSELAGIDATGKAVLSLPTLTGKPVIVLSAVHPLRETSELAADANLKRKDIARLFPGSQQIWVDSGHAIPLEKPEAVISAIREAMRAGASTSNVHLQSSASGTDKAAVPYFVMPP